jgi:hypothetical protein
MTEFIRVSKQFHDQLMITLGMRLPEEAFSQYVARVPRKSK